MFADRPALTNHENGCLPSKKRLAETLEDVQEVLSDHKRQRLEALASFLPNDLTLVGTGSNTNEGISGVSETEAVSTICLNTQAFWLTFFCS